MLNANCQLLMGILMPLGVSMKMVLTVMVCFAFAMVLKAQTKNKPAVADAEAFMKQAESRLAELNLVTNHASWVQSNFITFDTEALASDALDRNTALTTELVEQAKQFDGLTMPADLARKFKLLRLLLVAPAPKDPALRRELTEIGTSLEGDYGKGKYCPKPDDCLDIS